jgi:hypothetical protein
MSVNAEVYRETAAALRRFGTRESGWAQAA